MLIAIALVIRSHYSLAKFVSSIQGLPNIVCIESICIDSAVSFVARLVTRNSQVRCLLNDYFPWQSLRSIFLRSCGRAVYLTFPFIYSWASFSIIHAHALDYSDLNKNGWKTNSQRLESTLSFLCNWSRSQRIHTAHRNTRIRIFVNSLRQAHVLPKWTCLLLYTGMCAYAGLLYKLVPISNSGAVCYLVLLIPPPIITYSKPLGHQLVIPYRK